jgi:RNA polymerase sigma factor (sigma-70 family)
MAVLHRAVLGELWSFVDRSRRESDRELLRRFVAASDESAFAELVHRHAAMVLGLCRRVVGDHHVAEDVFQATFLTLARKARSIRRPEALAAWLHGVAFRMAVRARRSRNIGRARENRILPRTTSTPLDELRVRELLAIVDEELHALPESQRLPLILCCLEGLSLEEAARRLGWSAGAVKGRLERGRDRLRRRLEQRGLTLPGALAGVLAAGATQSAVAATLARSTVQAAVTGVGASPAALSLMQGALRTMFVAKVMPVAALTVVLAVLGAGAAWHGIPLAAPGVQEAAAAPKPNEPDAAADELPATAKRDLHGDPLPPGAVLRLGTVQRRALGALLSFGADGQSIIGVRGGRYIYIWDAATGKLRQSRTLAPDSESGSGSWEETSLSADGRWLVQDVQWRGIYVWDLATDKQVSEFLGLQQTSSIGGQNRQTVVSRDGKWVAGVGYNGQTTLVRIWDRAAGKGIFAKDLTDVRWPIGQLAFSPDGRRLLLSFPPSFVEGPNGPVQRPANGTLCWDIASGNLVWQNKEFISARLHFTHDGMVIAPRAQLPAIDLATGQPAEKTMLPPFDDKDHLATTPDGKILFVARADGVLVWDLVNGKEIRTFAGARGDLLPSADGKFLITNNGLLQRWDLASGKAVYPDASDDGHVDEVTQIIFSADGRRLASGARDGTVRLWDMATAKPLHVWKAHAAYQQQKTWYAMMRAGARTLDLSPDGRWLLSAGADPNASLQEPPPVPAPPPADRIVVWDTATGKEVRSIRLPDPEVGEHGFALDHARISPDGKIVTALFGARQFGPTTRPNSQLAQWDVSDGRLLRRHTIDLTNPGSATLAPGGKLLASASALIDPATGKELLRFEGWQEHRDMPAVPRAFSAYGLLVAGDFARLGRDENNQEFIGPGGLHVWESATGKAVAAQLKTKSWFAQVAFHPNSRYVAVNDLWGVQVWDLVTAKVVFTRLMPEEIRSTTTFGSHAGCLAFSPDGRRLATGLPDSTILVWEVNLPPTRSEPLSAAALDALCNDLKGTDAAKAWQAVWRLADAPAQAAPALRERLKARRDEAKPSAANALADQRAVAVLEQINSDDARQLLTELAKGEPNEPLTQQAKQALERVK